jgi:hypothetical protein
MICAGTSRRNAGKAGQAHPVAARLHPLDERRNTFHLTGPRSTWLVSSFTDPLHSGEDWQILSNAVRPR